MTRASGVLLHLTSLPGPFGIGKFGPEVLDFAKRIKSCGFSYWQVLPFGPPAAGNSPYQCYSAFAGNPVLIDPRQLSEAGLLTKAEVDRFHCPDSRHACDFPRLNDMSEKMLRLAFQRLTPELSEQIDIWQLEPEQLSWLQDYALFQAIRKTEGTAWWDWRDTGLKMHDAAALEEFASCNQMELRYQIFVQYWFFRQWLALKQAINKLGIQIIGDMPIYVSRDSSDVWACSQYFDLDGQRLPRQIAGVPPDYFAVDGQLWGNPLYDWPRHAADDFRWWVDRLGSALRLFDRVRLDHFRGFVSYWAVPADAETARNGQWLPGPTHQLFNRLFAEFKKTAIIAEDLGDIDDAVRLFLEETGLPGMRVMQFGFDPQESSSHLPCFYPCNCVAYSGTHDNNTLLGWLWAARPEEREFALQYAGIEDPAFDWGRGGSGAPALKALLRILWATAADLVMVPLQDLLGYGGDTRMNTPGEATGQWQFRITAEDLAHIDENRLLRLNQTYRRIPPATGQQSAEFPQTP